MPEQQAKADPYLVELSPDQRATLMKLLMEVPLPLPMALIVPLFEQVRLAKPRSAVLQAAKPHRQAKSTPGQPISSVPAGVPLFVHPVAGKAP